MHGVSACAEPHSTYGGLHVLSVNFCGKVFSRLFRTLTTLQARFDIPTRPPTTFFHQKTPSQLRKHRRWLFVKLPCAADCASLLC